MNGLRLALGTLTAYPVSPPTGVDRPTAGTAMVLAPLAGVALALPLAVPLSLAGADGPSLLLASLAVAGLALLTRGLHLDGLADTADGLGSGRPPAGALEVMRRSDIGPFGVVTLVLTLLAQVAALTACQEAGVGGAALLAAVVLGRGLLPVLCTPSWPAARADGLGSAVAGSVSPGRALLGVALALLLGPGAAVGLTALAGGPVVEATQVAVLAPVGLLAGLLLARHCRRRLGGLTGDVLGACVETTAAAALVIAALS